MVQHDPVLHDITQLVSSCQIGWSYIGWAGLKTTGGRADCGHLYIHCCRLPWLGQSGPEPPMWLIPGLHDVTVKWLY